MLETNKPCSQPHSCADSMRCCARAARDIDLEIQVVNGAVRSINDDEPLGNVTLMSGKKVRVDSIRREGRWGRRAFLLSEGGSDRKVVVGAVVKSIWPFGPRIRPERPIRDSRDAGGELLTPWEVGGRLERAINAAFAS